MTVLFCDVTGSTALGESLDPEALRALLARYFERMKAIVERHGGTRGEVHRRRGDGGVRRAGGARGRRAARVCGRRSRCATRCPSSGSQGRIGVMTGEVVTGTEERLATGDAVNVAARLEQAAQPGEVLIGRADARARRRRGRGRAGRAARAEGQGRAGRRLPAAAACATRRSGGTTRRSSAASASSRSLREAWERVRAEQRCELVTVVGDAGVGKSRLAGGGSGLDRGDGRPRPLPSLRRGDHLLAGGRGAEAARRAAVRRGRRGGDPLAARRDARRRRRRRRSPGRSARRWSRLRRSGRSSSCSTTSSGARRRSST